MSKENKKTVSFITEDGEEVLFYVLEQTSIVGQQYLLVTEEDVDSQEEAEVYIMKQIAIDEEDTVVYEFVEEDQELESISKVFSELLEETDIIK